MSKRMGGKKKRKGILASIKALNFITEEPQEVESLRTTTAMNHIRTNTPTDIRTA